jgi:hypothetical protein
VRWNLSVVLICISFMARDGEHFFMCFFAIWTSSFEKECYSALKRKKIFTHATLCMKLKDILLSVIRQPQKKINTI